MRDFGSEIGLFRHTRRVVSGVPNGERTETLQAISFL
jgi:hypothetical protein